jgi:hypothetical protein
MSRKVSSREFFHQFAKLNSELKPGETLVITKHGKPLGEFRKQAARRTLQVPDFKKLGLEPKASMAVREALYKKLMGKIESGGLS